MGRRVLVTGLSTFWGGRVAQALERDPDVDVIVGLDTADPAVALERTEFIRTDQTYSTLARLVRATRVDTILHTSLLVDSTRIGERALHEINVIGTLNLLAAAAAPDSSVRQVVVKSSTLVYGSSPADPTWFSEEMSRLRPPKTVVERSLLDVEGYLRDYAEDNPQSRVAILRCSNVLGADIVTPVSRALSGLAAPSIFGFDPLVQFVEENDVVRSIDFAMHAGLRGVYNVAGDGLLPWSEVTAIAGKARVALPPLFTDQARLALARLRIVDLPPELLALLRYGRGADNRRLKQAGFRYRHTTAGAVESFARSRRRRAGGGETVVPYRYERDVEQFFRHSAAVARPPENP